MKETTLEPLLERLLALTLGLEKSVNDAQEDPDVWVKILEERQGVMDSISGMLANGEVLSEHLKHQYIEKAYQCDQKILPILNKKKEELATKIGQLNRSKTVNLQYQGYGNIASYGAFFDQKN
ncbi:flagellar protein FliT [Brevibacillus sp. B_LB10_24]|uniref:flagellar protein FliT n=1 Tax=Brevibacillus sp. B_LB10_24 TaxID=3380645 RepID=UPI0038B9BB86